MHKSTFYKKHENFLKEYGDRGFFLAWIKFCKVQNTTTVLNTVPLAIPPKHVIKDELLSSLEKSNTPSAYVQLFHLFIKSMIIPEDDLSFIQQSDHRLIYWMIFDLNRIQNLQYPNNAPTFSINNDALYSDLIKYIDNQKSFITNIKPYYLINKTANNSYYLSWINTNPHIQNQNYDYQTLIRNYDLFEICIVSKANIIQSSFADFKTLKSTDNEISWIKTDEKAQQAWIIKYLINKKFYNPYIFEYSKVSYYDQILITLDITYPSRTIQRTAFIEKMKKAWTQQKYRDAGKLKIKYHLPLTKSCKEKLKKISELMNVSENKLLENLINEKYNSIATDENGKFMY
ncbi:hypothetical protein [Acinetobacter sp. YH12145]|uniref:hypothetical protein n=1 Tax=Acinetobacter sp. YH12145 TaxID=2601129 RepID=UPI0015D3C8F8|nr:hypothetical protein [Acinetobacter sp. YH12145]